MVSFPEEGPLKLTDPRSSSGVSGKCKVRTPSRLPPCRLRKLQSFWVKTARWSDQGRGDGVKEQEATQQHCRPRELWMHHSIQLLNFTSPKLSSSSPWGSQSLPGRSPTCTYSQSPGRPVSSSWRLSAPSSPHHPPHTSPTTHST